MERKDLSRATSGAGNFHNGLGVLGTRKKVTAYLAFCDFTGAFKVSEKMLGNFNIEDIIEKSVALGTSNIVLPENLVLLGDESVLGDILDADFPEEGIELNEEIAKIERGLIKRL